MPTDYAPTAITDGFKYLVDLDADMDGDGDYDNADHLALGGVKGDAAHYAGGGYHVPARACRYGDYSIVQPYDKGAGVDKYAASALDITPKSPAAQRKITQRLIDAVKRNDPRLYPLREFFGTTDGVTVTGRDVPSGRVVSSDDSHLWHVHLSFKRKYANDAAAIRGVMDIIAGKSAEQEFTVNAEDVKTITTIVTNVVSPVARRLENAISLVQTTREQVVRQNGVIARDVRALTERVAALETSKAAK